MRWTMNKFAVCILFFICLFLSSCNAPDQEMSSIGVNIENPIYQYEYSDSHNGYILIEYSGNEDNVVVPEFYNEVSVCAIEAGVFSNNSTIQYVFIPPSIKEIGEQCFYNCSNLKSVVIASEDDITLGSACFMDCSNLISIEIHGNLSSLPSYLFSGCSSLFTINLPSSLLTIEKNAFSSCTSLQSISIPAEVYKIDEFAFSGCSMLQSITLPDRLSSIPNNLFSKCTALTSIQISASTIDIDCSAFSSTNSLQEISVDENNPKYISIDGMLILRETRELIFYPGGKKETSLIIPTFVTTIGERAFRSENVLLELTLHENFNEIKNQGGSGCTKLEKLRVLSSHVIFHPDAFYRGGITYKNGIESNRTPYTYPFTIYCLENSTAVQYAMDNDIVFEFIEH